MKRAVVAFAIVLALTFAVSVALYAQAKAPGVVVLKGNPMGGVKFDHAAHGKVVGDKCDTCHHASKPEKAATAKQEKCSACHAKAAAAPMKTSYKLAFHDNLAKKGTCIDCHLKEAAAGKKTPAKCADCHKKENV